MFAHYGQVCACPGCGATDDLSIDHPDGDGAEHRETLGIEAGWHFYAWLRRAGFPEGYRTMCRPCNASKRGGPACRLWHGEPGYQRCTGPEHTGDRVLPLDQFSPKDGQRTGRHSWCRNCRATAKRLKGPRS